VTDPCLSSCHESWLFRCKLPTLEARLEAIRVLSYEEVQDLAVQIRPLDQLPLDYLHQLGDDDRTTAYRASCLVETLAWAVTGGTQVPQELQLRSCLATHKNQDSHLRWHRKWKNTEVLKFVEKDERFSSHLSEPCLEVFGC
jgi:hypothetical protein